MKLKRPPIRKRSQHLQGVGHVNRQGTSINGPSEALASLPLLKQPGRDCPRVQAKLAPLTVMVRIINDKRA